MRAWNRCVIETGHFGTTGLEIVLFEPEIWNKETAICGTNTLELGVGIIASEVATRGAVADVGCYGGGSRGGFGVRVGKLFCEGGVGPGVDGDWGGSGGSVTSTTESAAAGGRQTLASSSVAATVAATGACICVPIVP